MFDKARSEPTTNVIGGSIGQIRCVSARLRGYMRGRGGVFRATPPPLAPLSLRALLQSLLLSVVTQPLSVLHCDT